jgi:GAF domain-containing protein
MYMDEQATSEVALMDEQVRSTPSIATFDRVAHRSIQAIARRAVPALGDFAMVFMVAGRSINGIACAHISPAGNRILRALQRIYRIRRDDLRSTVAQVIRTGRPSLRRSIQDDEQPARPGSVADLHRRLACRSVLVLPIRVGHQVAGAVTLCYAGSGRTYARADLAGAQRVAREIARTVVPSMPHAAAPRLRAPVGDARRRPTVRRRMAARN